MNRKTRLLKPEENHRFQLVQSVAFEGSIDYEEEKRKSQEHPADDKNCRKIGVFSEDETVLFGCLLYNKYRCRFDDGEMLLGGIGGVATFPEYRRNGIIRTCMEFTLRDMYEQGYTFSFLYPFDMEYYRKFGFEAARVVHQWTISFSQLPKNPIEGSVEQIFPGDDLTPLLEVFQKFYKKHNLSSVREKYSEQMEKEDLLKQARYVFLYRNAAKEPTGFFIYRKQQTPKGTIMDCKTTFSARNDFLFLDTKTFTEMLSFIKSTFGSYYDSIEFGVPSDISLSKLVGDNTEAECRYVESGMVRVVNVEKALSMCKCRGKGEVILEITDHILLENNGVWKIHFEAGRRNRVEKLESVHKEALDISLPINEFSALICGEKSGEDIFWMPDVKVYGKAEELDKIFYRKKCFLPELF